MTSLSRYNFFVSSKNNHLVYNSRSGNLISIDQKKFEQVKAGNISEFTSEDLLGLNKAGVLVEGDEIEMIDRRISGQREASRFSHLVITPTLACNFQCPYCFQNEFRSKTKISDDTLITILESIESQKEYGSKIHITWFGGEPLSCTDKISFFHERLVARGLDDLISGVEVVTNAALLRKREIDILKSIGATNVQISIDSFYFKKAVKRGVLNQDNEISPILENAINAKNAGLNVTIRINVNSKIEEHLPEICDTLDSAGMQGRYYYARVEDPISESRDRSCANNGLVSRKDFTGLEVPKPEIATKVSQILETLKPRSHFCGATGGNMVIVAPDGSLSRCWHSSGQRSESKGHLQEIAAKGFLDATRDERWDGYRASSYDECRSCKVMPLCLGGCSHARVMKDIKFPPCTSIKFTIEDDLKFLADTCKFTQAN